MKKIMTLLLCILIVFACSCKKKKIGETDKSLITIEGYNGASASFKIITHESFQISTSAYGYKVTPESGTGETIITVTARENMETIVKEAKIYITGSSHFGEVSVDIRHNPFPYQQAMVYFGGTDGIHRSDDGGLLWYTLVPESPYINGLINTTQGMYAATASGLFLSINGFSSWNLVAFHDTTITCLLHNDNVLFAGTSSGLMRSTDGQHWSCVLQGKYINSLGCCGNKVIAGCTNDAVQISTDNGQTWTAGALNKWGYTAAVSNTAWYIGSADGLYRSTDNGSSWNHFNLNGSVTALLVLPGDTVYAGTSTLISHESGFHSSYDGCNTWSPLSMNGYNISALARNKGYMYAGATQYGLYISTDEGRNWSKGPVGNVQVNCICVY